MRWVGSSSNHGGSNQSLVCVAPLLAAAAELAEELEDGDTPFGASLLAPSVGPVLALAWAQPDAADAPPDGRAAALIVALCMLAAGAEWEPAAHEALTKAARSAVPRLRAAAAAAAPYVGACSLPPLSNYLGRAGELSFERPRIASATDYLGRASD
jgi:hypothetical protein